ncbi:MAG: kinase [Pseudomonadota bacterium]|jgi:D-glycerate 3-kinase|uniref:kinase n=1 Tax=Sphingobium yanoikuyae TaxID=13690 RepID=UPI0013786E2A|nr:kinase [Sphingobium yanoikuyae]NBB40411.1 kinase [Sphingobium yanoikuyae]
MVASALDAVDRLALRLLEEKDGLAVLGLCGAQGSGKSTLAQALQARMGARGVASAILSIDDLYLTKAERETLAQSVHPLLRTRGVPGTHDVALGLRVLDALAAGRAVRLPRFDKAVDDRLPEGAWPEAAAGLRLLILEGWCVGAWAQAAGGLDVPVNALERDEDGDGRWRRFVNVALAGDYQALFGRIDALALLAAPGFEVVQGWRTQQEAELRAAGGGSAVMNDAEVARFIQHYERLTRHILDEMPARADLVVALDAERGVTAVRSR